MTSKKKHNPEHQSGASMGVKVRRPRDTYKYQLKVGNKIVYLGITRDLEQRAIANKSRYPDAHIEKVGRRTTRLAARKWESNGLTHRGEDVSSAVRLAIEIHGEAIRELERH